MASADPTSVTATMPARNGSGWKVEDVVRMQRASSRAVNSLVGDRGGTVVHEAPANGQERAAARGFLGDDPVIEHRLVSGRYRSSGNVQLELRVDVDGIRPMMCVSGDFYQMSGATLTYHGSFVLNQPVMSVSPAEVVLEGEGAYTFTTGSPILRVTIPRATVMLPPPAATAQFMSAGGVPGASYTCPFESQFFRRVEFEQDVVIGVTPFDSYNTGLLPSGGPSRVLTVRASFAEAGIEMIDTGGAGPVPITLAGVDSIWTRSEMHAAMVNHFSNWGNDPTWRVWLLAATQDEDGNRGIMFDQQGSQRQGCAVFHEVIGGTSNEVIRAMLRTYVHELGHCFNLYHSHHKEYMNPPQPNRMDALSWMHYPHYYQSSSGSGAGAYWAAFPFQFDDQEIVHLRHAFRNHIIMGGNTFGMGASEADPLNFADPVVDHSGLRLELRAPHAFALGEPVVVELKLETTDMRGKRANSRLHPNFSYVQIGIHAPGGKTVVYRPFMQNCAEPEPVYLDTANPSVYDSAYIGSGYDGFYFDHPGIYELRAVYHGPDGSKVYSNVLRLRVRAPMDRQENELAELFLGNDQAKLLYLLGSDSPTLNTGNQAFDTVIDKYDQHPMAVYAKLVKGVNAARNFKHIDDHQVIVRPAKKEESAQLLSDVVRTSTAATEGAGATFDPTTHAGLDNITLNMAMRQLADLHTATGATDKAKATARLMLRHFKDVPPHVATLIRGQTAPYLGGEAENPEVEADRGKRATSRSTTNRKTQRRAG